MVENQDESLKTLDGVNLFGTRREIFSTHGHGPLYYKDASNLDLQTKQKYTLLFSVNAFFGGIHKQNPSYTSPLFSVSYVLLDIVVVMSPSLPHSRQEKRNESGRVGYPTYNMHVDV